MKTVGEIISKVRKIEIKTVKLVNEIFGGEYHSVFKGQGIEFSEVRPYQFGDDSRLIDWKVTARQNYPYIKVFQETRELNVLIVYDASYSTFFSGEESKREIGGEIAGILTFAALKNNDKTGLILFSNGVEKYISLNKGKKHSLNIVRQILSYKAKDGGTNFSKTLEEINSFLKRKTIIFIISDFLFDENDKFEKGLKILSKKHDVIGIRIVDKFEATPEIVGVLPLKDMEIGKIAYMGKSSFESFLRRMKKNSDTVRKSFLLSKADFMEIFTGEDYFPILLKFFKIREKRKVR